LFIYKYAQVGEKNALCMMAPKWIFHGHEDDEHHVATCFLFESTESVENVSVGFMAALHFAQLGNKVTLICEKQKVEKDFEATLSYLSRPRCVQALRNILFL